MSFYIHELTSLAHTQEGTLRSPIQQNQFSLEPSPQSYNYRSLSMASWGMNWLFTQRPDRAFVNHRFAASRPPVPTHMTSQRRRPIPLPEEYLDHQSISMLPSSRRLPELVLEPEPATERSGWVGRFWYNSTAVLPLWVFKMRWDNVRGSIVGLFRKPVGVLSWFLQNINWHAVFGLIVAYPFAKLLVPAFDKEVIYASKPLYVLFIPAAAWVCKLSHPAGI